MSDRSENPLGYLKELEVLLVSHGYDDSRVAMTIIKSLRLSLTANGYKLDRIPPPPSSYTVERAMSLRNVSLSLKSALPQSTNSPMTYPDRACALSMVSNSYLHLAHAFKVDSDVWSFAQEDLVPVLSAAIDESSLDAAVARLVFHIDRYITSLGKWLSY